MRHSKMKLTVAGTAWGLLLASACGVRDGPAYGPGVEGDQQDDSSESALANSNAPGQKKKGTGGTADSGTIDSGTADSGTADSGTSDSGTTDSGTSDSGPTDVFASCPVTMPTEGMAAPAMPSTPKPTRGVVSSEPTFGTCMARATDHAADGLPVFARNDYSRRQPFNADNTLYLIYSGDGGWFLYDAATLQKVKELPALSGDAEPQWHPTDPGKLYYLPINGGMKIYLLDVATDTSEVAADFTGKLPWSGAAHVWTRSEGSPSRDARYWGLMAQNSSFSTLGFIVWDMQLRQLVASMTSSQTADYVSMSPSGRWVTISWDNGTYAYSRDLSTRKLLHAGSEHSDLAIGANGDDVFVSIDYQSDRGDIFMVDLDTGVRTALTPTYLNGTVTAVHFSGKAYDRPGWVLLSTYESGTSVWLGEKVFVMELAANPRIYELAFHHSAVAEQYFAEPLAAVSHDFLRIVFNSNWDQTGSDDIDAYMLALPAGAF